MNFWITRATFPLPYFGTVFLLILAFGTAFADEQALSLEINVSGTVPQRCELSQLSHPSLSLEPGATSTIEFKVDCNTPFKYSLTSEKGGLALNSERKIPVNNKFSSLMLYDTKLSIPLEQGDLKRIEDRCSSSGLSSSSPKCEFTDSGSSIAISKIARLDVTPVTSELDVPLAGNYSDVITIEVSTR